MFKYAIRREKIHAFSRPIKMLVLCILICTICGGCGWLFYMTGHDIPLWNAARERKWIRVEELLQQGADPNDTTDIQNDRTALYWLIPAERVRLVNLMIKKGVDVNKIDTHGETALDYANHKSIQKNAANLRIVRLLRAAGAKTAEELTKGNTH